MHPTDIIYVEGEPTEEKVFDMLVTTEKRDDLMGAFIIDRFGEMKRAIRARKHCGYHELPPCL